MCYPELNDSSFLSNCQQHTQSLCNSHYYYNQKHQTPMFGFLFRALMISVLPYPQHQLYLFFLCHISTSTSLMPQLSLSSSSLFWFYFCSSQGMFYGLWPVPSTVLNPCLCCLLPAKLQPWVHARDVPGLRESKYNKSALKIGAATKIIFSSLRWYLSFAQHHFTHASFILVCTTFALTLQLPSPNHLSTDFTVLLPISKQLRLLSISCFILLPQIHCCQNVSSLPFL